MESVEELKKCKTCQQDKPVSEYNKAGGGKWLQPYCKPCDSERKKEYARKNSDKIKDSRKKYYNENTEKIAERAVKYYENNKAKVLDYHKEYGKKNKEVISQKGKEYRKNNNEYVRERDKKARINSHAARLVKEKERRFNKTPEQKAKEAAYKKQWNIDNRDRLAKRAAERKHIKREQRRVWCNNKSATDIGFRILKNLRSRARFALKADRAVKSDTTENLLGCTIPFFKQYFESLFTDGMSWDLFMKGEIHLEHIKPCSKFDLTKEDEQRDCFNYRNLQPMFKLDNLRKGSFYEEKKVA